MISRVLNFVKLPFALIGRALAVLAPQPQAAK